jgi:hypothetical protein
VNETRLRDALFELVPPETGGDWEDVIGRAGRSGRPGRRLMLVLAAALVATLAVGSALALSGKLGNLFHGTPVKDLTPRERFFLSESDLNGKVELLAKRNGDAFYIIRRADGTRCYFIGDARRNLTPARREGRIRFGGGGCIDPRVFPSRAMPVLDQSYYSYHRGDAESRLAGLQGFAADPVDRIGVIGRDNQIIFTLKVEQNVYTAGRRGFMGARGIVALDTHGKVLWVQCTAMGRSPAPQFPSGGCGKYKTTPPPNLPPLKVPRPPIEPPGPVVVQHGSGDGVTVDIRGSRITANLENVSPAVRTMLVSKTGKITVGCFKLVTVGGEKDATGTYLTRPFMTVLRLRPYNPFDRRPTRPPFDGCTAMGMYGHTWGDAHGTHDTIEIALTPRGRTYLAERAVARDLGWLARARVFREIRYALQPFTSATAARRLGAHAVPLATATSTPPAGKLGIWIGPGRRIVLAERAPTGRRLYYELRKGIAYRTNLLGLAQTF